MVAGHGPEQWPLQGTLALPRPALPRMKSCCSLASGKLQFQGDFLCRACLPVGSACRSTDRLDGTLPLWHMGWDALLDVQSGPCFPGTLGLPPCRQMRRHSCPDPKAPPLQFRKFVWCCGGQQMPRLSSPAGSMQ